MDYGQLIVRAGRLVWEHKFTWLLAAPSIAGSLAGNVAIRLMLDTRGKGLAPQELADRVSAVVRPEILTGVVAAVAVLSLLFWLVAAVGEGGLIGSAAALQRGEPMDLGRTVRAGLRLIGRFVAIDTILYLPLFVLTVAVLLVTILGLLGLVATSGRPGANDGEPIAVAGLVAAAVMALLCLIFLVSLLTVVLRLLAFRTAAVQGPGLTASIGRAWRLLRRHFWGVMIVGVLLYALRYLSGLLIGLFLLPLTVLDLVAGLPASGRPLLGHGVGQAIGLAGVVTVVAATAPTAIVRAVTSTAWTLAYEEWEAADGAGAPAGESR